MKAQSRQRIAKRQQTKQCDPGIYQKNGIVSWDKSTILNLCGNTGQTSPE